METIFLTIDYLDDDFDKARQFKEKITFGDFFAEGERRGAEYRICKTNAEEAERILGKNYKKYVKEVGRFDREAFN